MESEGHSSCREAVRVPMLASAREVPKGKSGSDGLPPPCSSSSELQPCSGVPLCPVPGTVRGRCFDRRRRAGRQIGSCWLAAVHRCTPRSGCCPRTVWYWHRLGSETYATRLQYMGQAYPL